MIRYYEIVIPETEADQRWPDVDTFVGGIFAAITGLGWTIQLNPWPNEPNKIICTVEALPHNDDIARGNRLFFPKVFEKHRRILYPEMKQLAPDLLVGEES